jgi:hypothetical protein
MVVSPGYDMSEGRKFWVRSVIGEQSIEIGKRDACPHVRPPWEGIESKHYLGEVYRCDDGHPVAVDAIQHGAIPPRIDPNQQGEPGRPDFRPLCTKVSTKVLGFHSSVPASSLSTARLLSCLTTWLVISTAIVVIGLAIEYVPNIKRRFEKRPFDWSELHELLGGVLITLGVLGELLIGVRINRTENRLRIANDVNVSRLNDEAGKARERAAQLEREAAAIRKQASDADDRAATANG